MKNEFEEQQIPTLEQQLSQNHQQQEAAKEAQLIALIIEIIVTSTLNEYYETSDKIP